MRRTLRLQYNTVFLPEFLSTITLSIIISSFFLVGPLANGPELNKNPHSRTALAMYTMIASALVGLTVLYRFRFTMVELTAEKENRAYARIGRRLVDLDELEQFEERLERFFGRTVRSLYLDDASGWPATINDAVPEYDDLKTAFLELTGKPLAVNQDHDEQKIDRVRQNWLERHRVFPPPRDFDGIMRRFGWRAVCLLPVAVFDVLLNVAIILSFNALQRGELMVYSAPFSLLASGFIARYVYYYMFTSTTMNKPIGARQ